jgi:Transposase IS66 family
MKMELPEIRPEERTPLVESLVVLIQQLQDRIAQLEETNQQSRDEIAVLKGQKPRPQIKPSLLETNSPNTAESKSEKRPGSAKRPKTAELRIHREVQLHCQEVPEGARIRGYEPYVVQELLIRNENTRYLRARYDLPQGGSMLAPFPVGVLPAAGGHFGVHLVTYLVDQYHQAQVTEPLLLEQLREYGIDISAGQLHRLLTENQEVFHEEKEEVLVTALTESRYIGTDDTAARHRGKNGYCTAIGNNLFSYFESTDTKSRLNFLQVLQGSHRDYAINDIAEAYWERQKLALAAVAQLTREGPRQFVGEQAWQDRLTELAITEERQVRVATEGALLGGLIARGVSSDLVVLSDGAQQFVVLVHAACWIHAERILAKLIPYNEQHRLVIENIRRQIWELYQDLKTYRQQPDAAQRPVLTSRFDVLVGQRTRYPNIDRVLREMGEHKTDLLRVLERPEVPLHNNGLESDIREFVKRRKISGGTRNDLGRRCRDTFASLKKTCRKLGVRFWDYLQDRICGAGEIPRLADLVRRKARETHAPNRHAVPA